MSDEVKDAPTGLALLMVPFEAHEIGKLPKPTKAQTDEVKANFKEGVRCDLCGAWHHPKVVHLDYVGHAAVTKRLLQADPHWTWEPAATTPQGTPFIDSDGGMWIRLTVCGVTRIGYGNADGKKGGDAIKEIIGDALRNAAMRFGAALELWHKGELYNQGELKDMDADTPPVPDAVNNRTGQPLPPPPPPPTVAKKGSPEAWTQGYIAGLKPIVSMASLHAYTSAHSAALIKLDKVAPDLRDQIELAIAETRHRIENANPFGD